MKKGRIINLLLAGITLSTAAYFISTSWLTRKTGEERPRQNRTLPGNREATSIIRNFRHVESRLNEVGWELSAKKAELMGNTANLEGIKVRFYTADNEVIVIKGDQGVIDMESNDIHLEGNVKAVYEDTYTIFTDQFTWKDDERELRSRAAVRIVGPEGEITGSNLVAKPDKKKFIVKGDVKVNLWSREDRGSRVNRKGRVS